MDPKLLREIWRSHNGKILGMILGFIISVLILTFGFFQSVFIILSVMIGYFIGKRVDAKEKFTDILDKILPPDYYR